MNATAGINRSGGGASSPIGQSLTRAITPPSAGSAAAGTENATASTGRTTISTAPKFGDRISAASTTASIAAGMMTGGLAGAAAAAAQASRAGALSQALSGIGELGAGAGKALEGLVKAGKGGGKGEAESRQASAKAGQGDPTSSAGKSGCATGNCNLADAGKTESSTENQVAGNSSANEAPSATDSLVAETDTKDAMESSIGKDEEQRVDLAWTEDAGAESAGEMA